VPPVRYPDGRVCLKIGGSPATGPVLDPSDLVDWYRSDGDATEAAALEASLRALLPGVELASISTAPCVVTATPSGYPYLGFAGGEVAVAVAGNGSAAKSSDELGRLAASLLSADGWTDSLDRALFEPRVS
jgi:sarcosine oxidase